MTARATAVGAELLAGLARRGVTDADAGPLTRALYASDASLYRVPPAVVARPRDRDELLAVLDLARESGTPLTMRGAGTSIAGNAVGPGIVVDAARHLHGVLALDPEARTARVEPGVVHAVLQGRARAHGLRLGPDPSSHTRCTIGGMVGNNACGSRALGYGRTADTVTSLRVALGTGEVLDTAAGPGRAGAELAALVDGDLGHVRTHHGRFSRQASGYALEHLLPERGRRVDRFLVGSEGTLGVVLEAEVALVVDAPVRLLVALGYPSMPEAADAVPGILAACRPATAAGARSGEEPGALVACEGLDARIVDLVRARPGGPVPTLPRGAGWLFAEVTGDTAGEARAGAARVVAAADALDHRVVADPAEAAALWRIRESGAGLAARSLARPAHAGWEDAAVPPEHLGAWLRDFDALLREHGLDGVPYGHFGDGCVHVRIDVPFGDDAGRDRGAAAFGAFLRACAGALRPYGGSLSGEHGDGRARSGLLPLMYDERSLALFARAKAICDPDGVLNPGVLVDPADPVDDLRPARPTREPRTALRLVDDPSLAGAVHRCTGVGSCVAPQGGGGGAAAVMCPSWLATRDEKDSTRGRARVLQEALDAGGDTLLSGLGDDAVHEALDLCLACKGCASDCPTGVDMAAYKAEALHQRYRGRPWARPRSHWVLGGLPRLARLAAPAAPVVNALAARGPTGRLARGLAGVDADRTLPRLARRPARRGAAPARPPDVWVWADTFTDHFAPSTAAAAIDLLAAHGVTARVIPERACCGLTWLTTGRLGTARRVVGRAMDALAPYAASGVPLLGLEPSCTAALRDDARRLVDDPRVARVAGALHTLGELLERLRVPLPDLTGVEVVAQPHCHQASVLGWEADARLLAAAGAELTRVGGCCGLAGSFGMEAAHREVSERVAETRLLPAVRAAGPGAVVLADGFSCRHQLADLAGVEALHLARLASARRVLD